MDTSLGEIFADLDDLAAQWAAHIPSQETQFSIGYKAGLDLCARQLARMADDMRRATRQADTLTDQTVPYWPPGYLPADRVAP